MNCAMKEENVSLERSIMITLAQIGFKPNLVGFRYLVQVIKISVINPDLMFNLNGNIYPKVSQDFGITINKLTKGIEQSLISTWNNNKLLNVNKVLHCDVYDKYDFPTPSEFISLITWFFIYK